MGTYGYDKAFLTKQNITFVELEQSGAKIIIVPEYQARVMTSTAGGDTSDSYGWINYKLIESGKKNNQFNPVGGEERFWLGPEGGPFSLYFQEGKEQVYENWIVPPVIDTEPFILKNKGINNVSYEKSATLTNASGTVFNVGIERTITLLSKDSVSSLLNASIPDDMKFVAFRTDNVLKNTGIDPWTKDGGLISIWLLGMFNPTSETTVFIPFNKEANGVIVNDEYFGKVPSDRLIVEDNILYFKIDGQYRSKIGIPVSRAKHLCGSYDSGRNLLTLVWYSLPDERNIYANGKWGKQEDPFCGDVVNAYNDGPVEDGTIMGPFYEIETSSPVAELKPGESICHSQCIIHIQGDEEKLSQLVLKLFNTDLNKIKTRF
ncbi:MAG: DUF6786 family protein [Bacteroidales bacterium]